MTKIITKWISRETYIDELSNFFPSDVSIYHQLPWLDAVVKGFGTELKFGKCAWVNGRTIALTPFVCKTKGPFSLIGTPLRGTFTEFCGPLMLDCLDDETVGKIMTELHKLASKTSSYIEWGGRGEHLWETTMISLGYNYSFRNTSLIDLSVGENTLWSSFQGRARNMIRKAEKANVTSRTIQPDKFSIGEYFEMLHSTFSRQGLAVPHPKSFFNQMIELSKLGMVHFVIAEISNEMVAGSIFLKDKKRMLFLSGTANHQGMNLAAPSMLQWHAMKEGIKLGLKEYDMGGLGVPSIDKFKRSFGGRDYKYRRWVYRSNFFKTIEPVALWASRRGWTSLGGKS